MCRMSKSACAAVACAPHFHTIKSEFNASTMPHYNSRKCIFATCGTGFLGSHLIDRLLARGDEADYADNPLTVSQRDMEYLYSRRRFEFIRHDVALPPNLRLHAYAARRWSDDRSTPEPATAMRAKSMA